MANLVEPINILQPTEERIIEFQGLNRKPLREDGEMSAMKNLTSDNYPLLTPRKPRGTFNLPKGAVKPIQIMTRFERIAMIAEKADGRIAFFYNRTEIDTVTGLTADTRMVAINTKICFFPQKTYLELFRTGSVVQPGKFGKLEDSATITNAETVLSNEDVRMTIPAGHDFGYDDAVNIDGTLTYTDKDGEAHEAVPCVASCAIENVEGNVLVLPRETFIELTGDGATDIKFTGTIDRTMPDLDYVIEWNNRLWGVSNIENTIYSCKLGDPKNWQYYQGTSLDSFYAQQGTDEDWTGAAAYSNHLIFFKQNSMAKIYGTSPSTFQTANMQCYGCEEGSADSIAIIDDRVLYKSSVGIMAYEGGTPYCISERFHMKFKNVVAGTEGRKYYCSLINENEESELMVLDLDKAMWHREDDIRFRSCCTLDGRLYFVCDHDTGDGFIADNVYIINPETSTESADNMNWMATFGSFDEYVENRKIYSRILIRLIANAASSVRIYISIDEGEWELVDQRVVATTGDYIPIVPRRCDRYSIKIEGTGDCSIKSLTRKVRAGSGGRL